MLHPSISNNFEALVVSELQLLRLGEQRLERLYSELRKKPQLRANFLRDLTLLQLRADRLDALLGPSRAALSAPHHV